MVLSPPWVTLLPADLAVWIQDRARAEGYTPEALGELMLRDYAAIVASADAERPAPPVRVATPEPPQTVRDAALCAVEQLVEGDVVRVHARVEALLGHCVAYRTVQATLLGLKDEGRLRRVRAGLYAVVEQED